MTHGNESLPDKTPSPHDEDGECQHSYEFLREYNVSYLAFRSCFHIEIKCTKCGHETAYEAVRSYWDDDDWD